MSSFTFAVGSEDDNRILYQANSGNAIKQMSVTNARKVL